MPRPRPRPLPAHVRIVSAQHQQLDADVMKIVEEICPAKDERMPDEVRQDEYDAYLAVLDLLGCAPTPRPRRAPARGVTRSLPKAAFLHASLLSPG
jgi:hypothetical protein